MQNQIGLDILSLPRTSSNHISKSTKDINCSNLFRVKEAISIEL